jgi:hypothetical protein
MAKKRVLRKIHIKQYISGIPFPAPLSEVIEYARRKGAPDGAIDILRQLPNINYKNEQQIINNLNI